MERGKKSASKKRGEKSASETTIRRGEGKKREKEGKGGEKQEKEGSSGKKRDL